MFVLQIDLVEKGGTLPIPAGVKSCSRFLASGHSPAGPQQRALIAGIRPTRACSGLQQKADHQPDPGVGSEAAFSHDGQTNVSGSVCDGSFQDRRKLAISGSCSNDKRKQRIRSDDIASRHTLIGLERPIYKLVSGDEAARRTGELEKVLGLDLMSRPVKTAALAIRHHRSNGASQGAVSKC